MLSKSSIHKIIALCMFIGGVLMPLPTTTSNATEHGSWVMAQPQAVTLTISPASPVVAIAGSSTLYVMVNNVSDLGAFEFTLSYLPSVVTVTNVEIGPFLTSTGRSSFPAARSFDNTAGKVRVGIASLGNAAGAVGSGVIMSITFKGGGTVGSSPLTFSGAQITNVAGNTIASTAQNSTITVQAGSATATLVPVTATLVPATATTKPPTATSVPATATPIPGQATSAPATATPVGATSTPAPSSTSSPATTSPPNPTGTALPPALKIVFAPVNPPGSNGLVGSVLLAQFEMANSNNDAMKDVMVRMIVPDFVLIDTTSIEPAGGTVENVPTTHKINPLEHQAEAAAKAVVWRLAQLPANGSKFTGKFKMVVTSAYDGKQPITLTTTVSGKTVTSQQAVSASASTSISACGYVSCSYIPLLFWR